MKSNNRVLLTGVTGFLGSHTTIHLLEKGYEVTGTLRNKSKADHIKDIIARHTTHVDHLHFAEAELADEHIWNDLMEGIDFVQHIAAPFPRRLPDNEDKLIGPTKEATLNILRSAAIHQVKRVVLTSAGATITYGKERNSRSGTYSESDWTNVENKADTTPYFRSKTIAEKAAWDFMKQDRGDLKLATVCPGLILGPILEKDFGTSANVIIKVMDGSMPGLPRLGFDIVDVRSVAGLLVLAMERPEAAHERFIGAAGYLDYKGIAEILSQKYPDRKIPKRTLPDFLVRLFSYFEPTLKPVLIDLGTKRKLDSSKARELLQWKPLPALEAILSCADSAVNLGLV
jgi:dihydroflavonol-4-reductase